MTAVCTVSRQAKARMESRVRDLARPVVRHLDADDRYRVLVHEPTTANEALADLIDGLGYRPVTSHLRSLREAARRHPVAAVLDAGCADWMEWASSLPANMTKILVANEPDFTLRLTAARCGIAFVVKGVADSLALSDRLEEASRSVVQQRTKVVIVDDSALSAELNAMVLRSHGIEAVIVAAPEELLCVLAAVQPDLLLLDLNMPRVDGLDLARIVRQTQDFELMPIVFLSAVTELDRQHAARRAGGDDFIGKPVDPGRLIAQVMLRIERSRHVRARVERDGMTGLIGHGPFKDRVTALAMQRPDTPLTLAMLDIDHFKVVNDTHGHGVGDKVIRTLAGLLTRRLRQSDVIGRYGGEEFGILMPATALADAVVVVDDLRQAFAQLDFDGPKKGFRATFSAGIAIVGRETRIDVADLFVSADRALYTAKAKGRNRVEAAS